MCRYFKKCVSPKPSGVGLGLSKEPLQVVGIVNTNITFGRGVDIELPMLRGRVGSKGVNILIDSGAQCTLVDSTVIRGQAIRLIETTRQVKGVTGHWLAVAGEAFIPFVINEQAFYFKCLIVDNLNYDVMMGFDLMKARGYILDFSRLGQQTNETQKGYVDQLVVAQSLFIPPRTRKCVRIKPTNPPVHCKGVWITPIKLTEEGVWVEEAISPISEHARVMACVINENNYGVTLERGTQLGVIRDCEEIGNMEADINAVINQIIEEKSVGWDDKRVGGRDRVRKILSQSNLSDLTLAQQQIIHELVKQEQQAYALEGEILKATPLTQFQIPTGDAPPIRKRPYRLPECQRKPLKDLLDKLQNEGIIRPSSSEWSAPIILVPKKTPGQYRLVVDYRALNDIIKKDNYPLPRVDDLLDRLEGSTVFTTLDLRWGYHQCAINPKDAPKTAFVCCEGLFEFVRMSMGLCNAPATFQRLLETIFSDMIGQGGVLVYIDDLILFSKSEEEHAELLGRVLRRLTQAGLSLKPEKCYYFQEKIDYLGHEVSAKGIFPLQANIRKVLNCPAPTNIKELRRFVGMASYYRKFVKNFAQLVHPLTELTKKKNKWRWGEAEQNAFEVMKQKLVTPPILAYPRYDSEFILYTDASSYCIGCVLSQQQDGEERVIAYGSRALNKAECNYSTTEQECLSVVYFTQEFRHILLGRKFTIISDHRPLVWLKNITNPTGRLGRWSIKLSEFDYEISYRKGRLNSNADFLSRLQAGEKMEVESNLVTQTDTISQGNQIGGQSTELSGASIKRAQNKDEFCKAMIDYLRRQELPKNNALLERKVVIGGGNYMLRGDGVLQVLTKNSGVGGSGDEPVIVLPEALKREAVHLLHDHVTAGHLGFQKTYKKVRDRFFWEGMYTDVKSYINNCASCHRVKTPPVRRRAAHNKVTTVHAPLERVQIDIIGPITPRTYSGMSVILVITDEFTKFSEAIVLENQQARTVAEALVTNFFCKFGVPKCIHSDQGRNFLSSLMKEISAVYQIDRVVGSAYHPESQGLVERCNKTIKEMLMHYVQSDARQWDLFVPFVMQAYNTSVSASTLFTPYQLFFGREARLPVDNMINKPGPNYRGVDDYRAEVTEKLYLTHKLAQENSQKARLDQKYQYDKKAKKRIFQVGDIVYITNAGGASKKLKQGEGRKFILPWKGPYTIVQRLGEVNYRLRNDEGKEELIHENRMKLGVRNEKKGGLRGAADAVQGEVKQPKNKEINKTYSESESSEESSDDDWGEGDIEMTSKDGGEEIVFESDQSAGAQMDEAVGGDELEWGSSDLSATGGGPQGVVGDDPQDVADGGSDNFTGSEEWPGEGEGNEELSKEGEETSGAGREIRPKFPWGEGTSRAGREIGPKFPCGEGTSGAGREIVPKFPCGVCGANVDDIGEKSGNSIQCTKCKLWIHEKCCGFANIWACKQLRGYQCSTCLQHMGPLVRDPLSIATTEKKGQESSEREKKGRGKSRLVQCMGPLVRERLLRSKERWSEKKEEGGDPKPDEKKEEIMKEGGRSWCNLRSENTLESRLRPKAQNRQNNVCLEESSDNFFDKTPFTTFQKQNYSRGIVMRGVYYKHWC